MNWCPALRTILANEEVVEGKSEVGGHPVIKKPIKQWLLSITRYAERLLQDLQLLNWPERTIEGQRNWIGKSEGARIFFPIKNFNKSVEIFTTRPDTIFGVTFMVLSPEHPLTMEVTTKEHKKTVQEYKEKTLRISDVDRKAAENKTGVFTGAYAIHPFTKEEIQIWIADYVLMDYGTGAIMAVPAHDERDFEFAKKFNLSIKKIMECEELPFTEDSLHIQSDFLNGLDKKQAIEKAIQEVEKTQCGKKEIQYKLKDWIFSRQRYWGEPFPLVHFEKVKQKRFHRTRSTRSLFLSTVHYEPSEKGRAAAGPSIRNLLRLYGS